MLNLISLPFTRSKTDAVAIPVCEDAEIHATPAIQELITQAKAVPEFKAEKNQSITLYDLMQGKVRRCFFHGLGPAKTLDAEILRVFAGRAVKNAIENKREQLVIAAPLAKAMPMDPEEVIQALLEGAYLGNHLFNTYKKKPKQQSLKKISLLVPPAAAKSHAKLTAKAEAICQATLTAREWTSMPSNAKSPQRLAQLMTQAVKAPTIKVQTLSEKQLVQKKFGALLAVAAGSASPARLVEMVYTPARAKKTIVLVGKGVTFDTGGINIKPSPGLETMKADMAGAAVVAATMMAVARLKPKHRVVGITPLVENMPSGTATRPGDIVTAYSGKTIEINNTDAEGRLILADAMAYAMDKYKPHLMIDLATLTGACMVALGEKIAGLFTADDELAQAILDAGLATFERCWRMPLPEDYKDLLKSEFADLNNISNSRYGGAITAALFLSEFTAKTRWAHIDIAGPAYAAKAADYCGPGGTGFGVRLLCHLITHMK